MVAATYEVHIDFGQDGTFGHASADITALVEDVDFSAGLTDPVGEFAPPSSCRLTVRNDAGQWYQDNAASAFYGLLKRGLLVRVRMTYGTTQQLWIGKLATFPASARKVAPEYRVSLTAQDAMLDLLATTYMPVLRTSVRVDEEIAAVLAGRAFVWPYAKSFWVLGVSKLGTETILPDPAVWTDLETARETLAFVGDTSGAAANAQSYLRDLVAGELGGRFFWQGRTGKFVFHNRHHDVRAALTATLTGSEVSEASDLRYADDVYNAVTVTYRPRAVGGAGLIIWEADNTFRLSPGQRRTITARYRDPADEASAVAAQDVLYMQYGTDWVATETEYGISVYAVPGGTAAQINLYNGNDFEVNLTTLRLRGTPLYTYDEQSVTVQDEGSIALHGRREMIVHVPTLDDSEQAERYARFLLGSYKSAVARLTAITFRAGQSAALMACARDRTIGDRIRVNLSGDSWTEHDQEYIIVGERHYIAAATGEHHVTWTLRLAARAVGWKLGTSQLEIDTVLVF